jgi:hypothetical protein
VLLAGDGCAAFDRRLHGAQARGVMNEPEPRTHLVGRRGVATNIERDNGAVAFQLFARDRVCRVATQARVPGIRDTRMRERRKATRRSSRFTVTTPESRSECPPMNFVADWKETSAPRSRGR